MSNDRVFLHVRLDGNENVSVLLEDAPGGRTEAILHIGVGDINIAFTGSPWSVDHIAALIRDDTRSEWCKRWTGKKVSRGEGGEVWTIKRCYYYNSDLGYRVDLLSADGEALRLGEPLESWRFVEDRLEVESG